MNHCEFRDMERDLSFGVTYAQTDPKIAMPSFKEQVKLDPRVTDNPNHAEYTLTRMSAFGPEHPMADEVSWHPNYGPKNVKGVAVFAEGVYDDGAIDPMYLALAFQGVDETRGTLFAGLHGKKAQRTGLMFVMAAGKANADLEGTLQEFFESTNFPTADFPDKERREFESGYDKVLAFMQQYDFIDNSVYLPVAPLFSRVGERIIKLR